MRRRGFLKVRVSAGMGVWAERGVAAVIALSQGQNTNWNINPSIEIRGF